MLKVSLQNWKNYESNIENSKKMAVIELVGFVSFALISKEVADPFLGPYSGTVTLITTLILLTAYMSLRGQNWSSMGLRPLPSLKSSSLKPF